MILQSLFGLSLALRVSLELPVLPPADTGWMRLSAVQRQAALLPYVQKATDCVVRGIAADARAGADLRPDRIERLIAHSLRACKAPLRSMVVMHDALYGPGSGKAFLLGPYLDVLPAAVVRQVRAR